MDIENVERNEDVNTNLSDHYNDTESSGVNHITQEDISECIREESEINSLDEPNSIEKEYKKNITTSIKERDSLFNNLISEFTKDYERRAITKNELKKHFFYIIIALLIALVCFPLIFIWNNSIDDAKSVVVIIGCITESFAAFQILPKLIAEYLFDPKEDEKLLEIIKNMQDYNSHQHDNLNKHH